MTKKMSNELFNVDPTKLNKEEPLLLDGLYKYNKVTYKDAKDNTITPIKKYVYVLAYEPGEGNKKINDRIVNGLPIISYDEKQDDSNLDSVLRILNNELKVVIKDNDIDRIIYLGDIEYNNFLDCSIPCYAVNVKGLVKKKDDIFKVNDHSYITKMNYLDVIKNGH
jgi:hypothetical protein